jgi:ADP-heptose:LPS heptosyltransferase
MEKKVLIYRRGGLGDTLLTFPLSEFFKKQGCKVYFVGNTDYLILGKEAGLIDKPLSEVPKNLENYKEVITISSKPFLDGAFWIYPFPNGEVHITDYYLSAVGAENFEYSKRLNIEGNSLWKNRIILHPGSGSEKKNPPLEFYKELYLKLEREGEKPIFVLGEAEEKLKGKLERFEIYEVKDILQVARTLKGAKAFIGNDSGFSHLAGYLGVPTIVIFGPTNPKVWKPIGKKVKVLYKGLKCSPCFPRECSNSVYKECLHFSVEDVLEAVYQLI